MPKLRRLKPSHKIFVKKIIHDRKPAYKAYMEAQGNNNAHASRVASSRLLAKPSIQNEINRQLEVAGLTNEYTDQSARVLLDSALANAEHIRPEAGVAIIRMLNELRDRFPAQKRIQANINVENEHMSSLTINELRDQLNEIQEKNKQILYRLEQADSNQ